jgi:hypothetical protein
MPNFSKHQNQAQRNERFFRALDKTVSIERKWIVTVAFYAALHWVEAYFDNRYALHFPEHTTRNNAVMRLGLPIATDYLELYKASHNARYLMYRFSQREVDELINISYTAVKSFVQNTL